MDDREDLKNKYRPTFDIDKVDHLHVGDNIVKISIKAEAYGFKLYTQDYFKEHTSTEQDFKNWLNGFRFEIEAIKEGKELRRFEIIEEIKSKLENKRILFVVGESGTSKSTVLNEIICDYVEKGYFVLYNYGSEIYNVDLLINFIEDILKDNKKLLVALDDAHSILTAPIFYAMDKLSHYKLNHNLRFILTARLPDFDNFIYEQMTKLQETYGQSIRKITDISIASDFRYELPPFSKENIEDFIRKFGSAKELKNMFQISKNILDNTKGNAGLIKFAVLGQGLKEDVVAKSNRYLYANIDEKAEKIKTMIICSLLRILDFNVTDELLKKIQLYRIALALDRATLYHNSGTWDTIHRIWTLEFISFMFPYDDERRLNENREVLWDAFNSIIRLEDEKTIVAFVRGLFFCPKVISLDVEQNVCSYLENSNCRLNPRTVQLLWSAMGSSLMENPIYLGRGCSMINNSWDRVQLYNKALECFNKAIAIDPNNISCWDQKIAILHTLKRYEEVFHCYNKIIELDPTDKSHWRDKGECLKYRGRFEEALKCYKKVAKIDPTDSYAWNEIGDVLKELGKFKAALKCINKAIEIAPTNKHHWHSKGCFLWRQGKFDDAFKCFNKMIEIDPSDPYNWDTKAHFLRILSRYTEALECINKAIEIAPTKSYFLFIKAEVLKDSGRFDEALECHIKKVDLDKNDVDEWITLIEFLIDLNEFERALEYCNNALEINWINDFEVYPLSSGIDDDIFDIWRMKGDILDKLGRHSEALVCYKESNRRYLVDLESWYNKARFKLRQGNTEGALEDLKKAVDHNRDCFESVFVDKDFETIKFDKRFIALKSK